MTEPFADISTNTVNTVSQKSVPEAYWAARKSAAFVDLSSRGRIVLKGADRASYLQGLLTNDIEALKPGEGCYALLLTPQGRIMSDMSVFNLGEEILLDVHESVTAMLVGRFQDFVFTEDVTVEDRTESWTTLAVHGPASAKIVSGLVPSAGDLGDELCPEYRHRAGQFSNLPVVVTRSHEIGEVGLVVYADAGIAERLRVAVMDAEVAELDEATFNLLRLESGRPVFPTDLDSETIPLEAGIEDRAISQTKGCYVGQEVIVRILHRGLGKVARRLVGFSFAPDEALPDTRSRIDLVGEPSGEPVGTITTVAFSPALGRPIALGYVKRELAAVGGGVVVKSDARRVSGRISSRPFLHVTAC